MKKLVSACPIILAIIFAGLSFFLMLGPAKNDSAIMDELAHIPAGYGYVKYFDYRLNPEHPPLVKMLAAIPLLFQKLNFPTDKSSWTTDINGQWAAGAQFLYESGNDADKIIFWARLGPMILTLLLIIAVYFCAKELVGRWWALLPAFLIALSPNFLAHGHYVTTDIGAALGIFLAIFCFLKFLSRPTKTHLFLAGIAFGIAQLMKFSAVLLIPYLLLAIAIFYLISVIRDWKATLPQSKLRKFGVRFLRYLKNIFFIFIIGYVLVYLVYALTVWNYPAEKQYSDSEFILQSFSPRFLVDADLWMIKIKALRPLAQYLLGVLMVGQRAAGGNTSYFLGEVSGGGWRYYFPAVFVMKEALPILLMILLAFLIVCGDILKSFKGGVKKAFAKFNGYLNTNFPEFSMILFIAAYWSYSMLSPLNIGFRHLMPILPLIYILSAGAIRKWTAISWGTAKKTALLFLGIWLIAGVYLAYPYFLSRFNELSGGTYDGYKYAVDSNFDWGQDLKRLKEWIIEKNNVKKIAVDYFGGGNLKYYFGDKAEDWRSALGNPAEEGIEWLAVSVNTLQGALGKTAPGFIRQSEDEYRWLKNPYQPTGRAGTSIFIYKLQ